MTDRLAELTGGATQSFDGHGSKYSQDPEDPEGEMDEETRAALQAFQKEADAITAAIAKVQETVHDIEGMYAESMVSGQKAEDRLSAEREIQRMLVDNEKRSDAIRKRLRRIAGENKMFRGEHPSKTGELRVRVNTHQGMTKRFMAAMQAFEETQEKHRRNVKTAMEQQLRSMNPTASEEEIAEAVREGQEGWIVDNSQMMNQLPPAEQQRLKNGLSDLRSRNNDIKKLEASIIQLHQLFVDMQVLVEAQGELLNNIEYNVEETKGATEAAHEELVMARNHQKSANRKKCILVLIVIAILAVIIIVVGIIYIPKWFPKSSVTGLIEHIPGVSPLPSPSPSPGASGAPAGTATNTTRLLGGSRDQQH
jgi:syntaxin 1B/2/3